MATYYVSVTGSNSGNGSAESPWRTISKAMWNLEPGDEVVVGSGTYNEFVRITKSGTADDYITVRSEVPGGARIVPPANQDFGVHIQGDYVKLDGFEVSGARKAGITTHLAHHVVISNNEAHDNATHGISVSRSDYVTVEGNITHDNASSGFYSGISIFHPENLTGDTTSDGFRIIVRNNISYDNVTETGPHSDGNGIIMDDFRSTKAPERDPYLFPSLVENNLVYNNGGKGIQVDWTDYATVRNNTAWHNNVDPLKTGTWHGELSNMNSSNNTWVNNIAVADPEITGHNTAIDNTSYVGYQNSNNIWANNLTFNETPGDASVRNTPGNGTLSVADGNLLGVDPMLVGPPHDFRLDPDSAAIDRGIDDYGFALHDLYGNERVGAIDIGSHEAGISDPSGSNHLLGGSGKDQLYGYGGNDTLLGQGGSDSLRGGEQDDSLSGGAGGDFLDGGKGHDLLRGGTGRDMLVGNVGADVFVFNSTSETGIGSQADQIRDFSVSQGDRIDLTGIDANTAAYGDQAFTFIGSEAFSKTRGELQYLDGLLAGDVNGDRIADFHIAITNGSALHEGDFLL